LLFVEHIVFGLFVALALTSASRGMGLYAYAFWSRRLAHKAKVPADVPEAIGVAS
jgi:hypothetical protein